MSRLYALLGLLFAVVAVGYYPSETWLVTRGIWKILVGFFYLWVAVCLVAIAVAALVLVVLYIVELVHRVVIR